MAELGTPRLSRRRILSGLALFGAGAASGGTAVTASNDRRTGTADVAGASPTTRQSLTLRTDRLVATVHGRVPGELRPAHQPAATRGDVLDAAGAPAGRYHSAAVPGSSGALMLHTFELDGGTILGMGSGPLSEATYAVVGGTGRFRGATGSYLARQQPRDLGGDGTAEFVFDLTTEGT